ncbi:MAG: general secretion pathway protein GspB [Candidatus Omnitrophota bacterium]
MSIITDALKKAQKTRTEESGEEKEKRIEPAGRKKISFRSGGVIAILAAVLIACIAGVLLFVNRLSVSPTDIAGRDKSVPSLVTQDASLKKGVQIAGAGTTTKSFPNLGGTTDPAAIKDLPVLAGLMYSPTHPQAIINGALVSEGDTVDGFTVNKILPNKVLISYDGKEFELNFR